MKKCLALALSILMLVTILPMALVANATISATVSATWEDGTLTFTWTGADGYVVKMAKIDNNEMAVTASGDGSATVAVVEDCSAAAIQLGFAESAEADVTEWVEATYVAAPDDEQIVQTQMELLVDNGKVTVTVTDDAGNPMQGVPVALDFGSNVDYDEQITDENGQAFFAVAASSKAKIVCRVADWTVDDVVYKGCSVTYGGTSASTTTTTTTKRPTTTTTKRPTKPQSTTTTHDIIIGAGTTSYPAEYAGYVAVDAIFDSGVLEVFGVRESEFANRAQLLIKREEYDRWVGEEGASLMLSVRFSNAQVNAGQIHNAIKDDYELMSFDANEVAHVSASLSAQLKTADGELITLMLDDSEYIVRLPIPKNMSNASLIMVSQQIDNTLSTPVGVSIKKGYFEFTTANLADLTFLGFVIETETDNNYFVFTVILVAAGLVLLIGAVLILYFCVLRKPKAAKKDEEDEMTDLYSDDLPMMDGDINEDGEIVIAPMEDIVDLPPQKFADDIIIPGFSEDNNG